MLVPNLSSTVLSSVSDSSISCLMSHIENNKLYFTHELFNGIVLRDVICDMWYAVCEIRIEKGGSDDKNLKI